MVGDYMGMKREFRAEMRLKKIFRWEIEKRIKRTTIQTFKRNTSHTELQRDLHITQALADLVQSKRTEKNYLSFNKHLSKVKQTIEEKFENIKMSVFNNIKALVMETVGAVLSIVVHGATRHFLPHTRILIIHSLKVRSSKYVLFSSFHYSIHFIIHKQSVLVEN